MITKQNLPHGKPQDRRKHPERWQDDLNPGRGAVATAGTADATEPATRPAAEIKRAVRKLADFTHDELEEIPVIEPGSRLRPRAVYVDLADPSRRAFTATDDAVAGADSLCVAKASVARGFWNRLVRVPEPERDKGLVAPEEVRGAANVPREPTRHSGDPRPRADSTTRMIEQGDNEQHGGRERSERRGGEAVGPAHGSARHPKARPH
jgi:hypothetical protein